MLRYRESGSAQSMVTGQGQTSMSVEAYLELLSPKSVPHSTALQLLQLFFGLNPACTAILKNRESVCILSFPCKDEV